MTDDSNDAAKVFGQSTGLKAKQQARLGESEVKPSEGEGDEENKIGKPVGEVGRPGRGGYNLQEVLNWAPKDFKKVDVSVASLQCTP